MMMDDNGWWMMMDDGWWRRMSDLLRIMNYECFIDVRLIDSLKIGGWWLINWLIDWLFGWLVVDDVYGSKRVRQAKRKKKERHKDGRERERERERIEQERRWSTVALNLSTSKIVFVYCVIWKLFSHEWILVS